MDPVLHTPCISSRSHHLFAAHAHTIAASSAVIPLLCHLCLVSLSAPYLEICLLAMSSTPSLSLSSLLGSLSFSLAPHIHLTILISARYHSLVLVKLTVTNKQENIVMAFYHLAYENTMHGRMSLKCEIVV